VRLRGTFWAVRSVAVQSGLQEWKECWLRVEDDPKRLQGRHVAQSVSEVPELRIRGEDDSQCEATVTDEGSEGVARNRERALHSLQDVATGIDENPAKSSHAVCLVEEVGFGEESLPELASGFQEAAEDTVELGGGELPARRLATAEEKLTKVVGTDVKVVEMVPNAWGKTEVGRPAWGQVVIELVASAVELLRSPTGGAEGRERPASGVMTTSGL
jgi:hypothetical protein